MEATRTDRDVQAVSLRLPPDVYEAVKTYAFITGTKINEVMVRAIVDFLASRGRTEELDALFDKATDRYRVLIDKLKES